MNLVLDIGNSYGKIAVCENTEVIESAVYEKVSGKGIGYFRARYDIRGVIISSVGNDARELIDYLGSLFSPCIELNHTTPIPLVNRYRTPETLGYDRIAAAVGGHTICPQYSVLVIDAGTAITYDVVTKEGHYLGGNISPGLSVRFRALNKYTSKLPLLEKPEKKPPLVGSTTREAIESGIVNGIAFEMDGFIHNIAQNHPNLQVVLTGGDANYFADKLKSSIFVDLNLNLIGLNRILEHNAAKEI